MSTNEYVFFLGMVKFSCVGFSEADFGKDLTVSRKKALEEKLYESTILAAVRKGAILCPPSSHDLTKKGGVANA